MEREVYGKFKASLRAAGALYAIFEKDVMGKSDLIMYEVLNTTVTRPNDPAAKFSPHITNEYFKVSQSLPTRFLSEQPIPVYKTSHIPCDQAELDQHMAELHCNSDCPLVARMFGHRCEKSDCQLNPAQHLEAITLQEENDISLMSSDDTIVNSSTLPNNTTVGVLETTWMLRTGSIPPPYSRLDSRRRAVQVAHVNPDYLLGGVRGITATPPPHLPPPPAHSPPPPPRKAALRPTVISRASEPLPELIPIPAGARAAPHPPSCALHIP